MAVVVAASATTAIVPAATAAIVPAAATTAIVTAAATAIVTAAAVVPAAVIAAAITVPGRAVVPAATLGRRRLPGPVRAVAAGRRRVVRLLIAAIGRGRRAAR
jgi:hypothetical protein